MFETLGEPKYQFRDGECPYVDEYKDGSEYPLSWRVDPVEQYRLDVAKNYLL